MIEERCIFVRLNTMFYIQTLVSFDWYLSVGGF
jgi:hypothetical protein